MRTRRVLMGVVVVGLAVAVALWPRDLARTAEPQAESHLSPAIPSGSRGLESPTPQAEAPVAANPSEPTTPLARFEGVVVSAGDERPIEDATLEFHSAFEVSGKTDREGRFSVELPEGVWSLRVTAERHVALERDVQYVATAGTVVSSLRFELLPGRRLTAIVQNEQGQPLQFASLSAGLDIDGFDDAAQPLGQTNSTGGLTTWIAALPNRVESHLVVEHDCCWPHREALPAGDELLLTIRLRPLPSTPTTALRGIVVDESEARVPGAIISATSWIRLDGAVISRDARALTRADGTFTLALAATSARVSASDGISESESVELVAGDVVAKLMLHRKDASISGQVTDESGRPVTAFRLELEGEGVEAWTEVVSADGRYQLERQRPGRKKLVLEAKDFARGARAITLEPGQELTGVDFVLSRGRTVRGTVIDERTGGRIASAQVTGAGVSAQTDERGDFVLRAQPRAAITLQARHHAYATRDVLVSGEEVTIALRPRSEDGGFERDYEGVGLGLDYDWPLDGGNGYPVLKVLTGGGAEAAGIQVADEILAADGTRAGALDFREFNSLIRGAAGTRVQLTVRRDGRDFELSVQRRQLTWK